MEKQRTLYFEEQIAAPESFTRGTESKWCLTRGSRNKPALSFGVKGLSDKDNALVTLLYDADGDITVLTNFGGEEKSRTYKQTKLEDGCILGVLLDIKHNRISFWKERERCWNLTLPKELQD